MHRVTGHDRGVPTMFALMFARPDLLGTLDRSSVRRLSIGSAPMTQALFDQARELFPDRVITNGYGTTEVVAVFGGHPDGAGRPDISVGYPLAAVRNPPGRPKYRNRCPTRPRNRASPRRVVGVRSPGGDERATTAFSTSLPNASPMAGTTPAMSWRPTSRAGTSLSDGSTICSRAPEENVYPGDVEQMLERCPAVHQAAVVPVADDLKGALPVRIHRRGARRNPGRRPDHRVGARERAGLPAPASCVVRRRTAARRHRQDRQNCARRRGRTPLDTTRARITIMATGTSSPVEEEAVSPQAWRALAIGAAGFVLVGFNTTATNLAFSDITETFASIPETTVAFVSSGYLIGGRGIPAARRTYRRSAGAGPHLPGRRRTVRTHGGPVSHCAKCVGCSSPPGCCSRSPGRSSSRRLCRWCFRCSPRADAPAPSQPGPRRGPLSAAIAPSASAAGAATEQLAMAVLHHRSDRRGGSDHRSRLASEGSDPSGVGGTPRHDGRSGRHREVSPSSCFGVGKGKDWGWASTLTIGCFVVAAMCIVAFFLQSRRHPQPLMDLGLFAERQVWMANLSNTLVSVTSLSIWLVWPLYLRRVLGTIPTWKSGWVSPPARSRPQPCP